MNAQTQYTLGAGDLEVVLALVRGKTLAGATERLGVDASTVFRAIQRIERGLGQPLFGRARSGYAAGEVALQLAAHGERLEAELEAARSAVQVQPDQVAGAVRLTSTDTVLHALVAPALCSLQLQHPLLSFDLQIGNELANLSQRDADIAVRATLRPPPHLVGKRVGPLRVALFAPQSSGIASVAQALGAPWIAPDEALPEHPSVRWRKRHFPRIVPQLRVTSILTAAACARQGMGVAVLPLFLAANDPQLRQVSEVLDECQTELWLLTHPEGRHLRRVATVFGHLARQLRLD